MGGCTLLGGATWAALARDLSVKVLRVLLHSIMLLSRSSEQSTRWCGVILELRRSFWEVALEWSRGSTAMRRDFTWALNWPNLNRLGYFNSQEHRI